MSRNISRVRKVSILQSRLDGGRLGPTVTRRLVQGRLLMRDGRVCQGKRDQGGARAPGTNALLPMAASITAGTPH